MRSVTHARRRTATSPCVAAKPRSWRPSPRCARRLDHELVPAVVDPEVIWACTTCRWCERACPLDISYVDKLVEMRQNLVLEKAEFPEEAQPAFRGYEVNGNPWQLPAEERGAVGPDRDAVADLNREAVAAGEFPGSIRIPGPWKTSLQIGGFVRVLAISDSDAENIGEALLPAILGTRRDDDDGLPLAGEPHDGAQVFVDPTRARVFAAAVERIGEMADGGR